MDNETEHLKLFRGHPRIRQLLDTVSSPRSIVLEYMEDNLRSLSVRRKLESAEIRSIARQILEALAAMHGKNLVHTGGY